VSLIESALAKLRRVGETDAKHAVVMPRAPSVAKGPAVTVAPVPTPEPEVEVPTKHFSVDLKALRDAGYLPEEGLERRFADHFRQIKRPLIEKALADGGDMRLIMVSSALPGDGKSFTSINLAFSIARERDISVLLVDADTPRARVSEVLGLRGEPGLLDALTDHSLDIESLIGRTDVRGLDFLPAGRLVEGATELLASARMRQIAARLCARNSRRLVVFDSAPLLVSSEARILTRIPGQIVLVARTGMTPRRAVADALKEVDKSKIQGLILNHTPRRKGGDYYYGYSGYGSDGEAPTEGS
jgi:protein-tyrosine kinase